MHALVLVLAILAVVLVVLLVVTLALKARPSLIIASSVVGAVLAFVVIAMLLSNGVSSGQTVVVGGRGGQTTIVETYDDGPGFVDGMAAGVMMDSLVDA
jgi:hypothetical protein